MAQLVRSSHFECITLPRNQKQLRTLLWSHQFKCPRFEDGCNDPFQGCCKSNLCRFAMVQIFSKKTPKIFPFLFFGTVKTQCLCGVCGLCFVDIQEEHEIVKNRSKLSPFYFKRAFKVSSYNGFRRQCSLWYRRESRSPKW